MKTLCSVITFLIFCSSIHLNPEHLNDSDPQNYLEEIEKLQNSFKNNLEEIKTKVTNLKKNLS